MSESSKLLTTYGVLGAIATSQEPDYHERLLRRACHALGISREADEADHEWLSRGERIIASMATRNKAAAHFATLLGIKPEAREVTPFDANRYAHLTAQWEMRKRRVWKEAA